MKILIAPDKFKGSMSASTACQTLKRGLSKHYHDYDILLQPMADGGDGSLEVISNAMNVNTHEVSSVDPLGRSIMANYITSKGSAFIELASASGLVLLDENDRDALETSTLGTGLLVADAISKGFRKIYLLLGGSATNDAGIGIAAALGFEFTDVRGNVLKPIGANLYAIQQIMASNKMKGLDETQFFLLTDVQNPLYGPDGAAHVYAEQKGANQEQIEFLDRGLHSYAHRLYDEYDIDVSQIAGVGAAGGVGASLVALLGAKIQSGFDVLSSLVHLEKKIKEADWVISGEGKLDAQSLQGKVVSEIANLCMKYNKPLTLFVGTNELTTSITRQIGVEQIYTISDLALNLDDAMQNSVIYLEQLAENHRFKNLKQIEMNPIFEKVEKELVEQGFEFERTDFQRPWGGFFVIEEDQTEKFARRYFPELSLSELTKGLKVSPKILLVAPHKRLSWQYHHRRSEIWRVTQGKVGVISSDTDEETPMKTYSVGDVIVLQKEERHRLIGLEDWGIVAEIWQHTDPNHPSDENDIVRLQDDYNRKTPQ